MRAKITTVETGPYSVELLLKRKICLINDNEVLR